MVRLVPQMSPHIQTRVVEMMLKTAVQDIVAWNFIEIRIRKVPSEDVLELKHYHPISERIRST